MRSLKNNEQDLQIAYTIYNEKLPTFDNAEQKQIANALKDYWGKVGKWKGKQSKKQGRKIEKIKSILE